MKKWQLFLLMCLFLSSSSYVMAQNITITGQVSGSDGSPLSNVSIFVTGTNQGTSTNDVGNYTINAPGNASLTFTYVGHISQTVPVNNRTSINITLEEDATSLDEVVVTALGIERSAKSLTYNTTNVSADDLNQVKGANVLNNLAGRAAGVQVTQGSGGPGSSPRIVLRGNKSISGNNQPLYVVDGIPVGGFSDFNQEDIESLQVLQGASAAALYGSQAANGVILITTKKGRFNTTTVDIASTATFENPLLLPQIQTGYGQGQGGEAYTGANDSWGPRITNGSDAHIRDFFRTGSNLINSVSVSSGTEKSRVYASYANTEAKGMIPNNDYTRNNFTVRGNTKVFNDKVTLDAGINYIQGNTKNQNFSSWNNSPMFGLYLFPVGDDMGKYSPNGGAVWDETRLMYTQNWPYIRNERSSNQNPYWIVNNILRDQPFKRTNFMSSIRWDITDWLSATGRATLNQYNSSNEQRQAAGSDPIVVGANGSYRIQHNTGSELFTDFMLNANKDLSPDLTLNAFVGVTQTKWNNYSIVNATNGTQNTLTYPNFFSVYALNGPFLKEESKTEQINRAVFGSASFAFKQTLFLDVTARNEWSSTVSEAFFYPSVGLSYVLSENLPQSDVLSFAKLRASYAEVGNGLPFGAAERAPNYTLDVNGNVNGRTNLPFFSGTDTITLRPERTKSWEVGAELGFFNNALNLNVTYYDATTEDQVFTIQAPSGSGATNFWINGGTIQNRGIEANLSYRTSFGQVTWNPSMNFTRNTNRIKMLSDLLTSDRFILQSGNRLTNFYLLRPGSELLGGRKYGAYHDMFGKTYQYDENGNQLFNENGLPLLSPIDNQYLGNANPDFLLNWNNSFGYKNFSLSFLLDSRWGGLVSSSTEQWLDYKGLSKRSGDARDAGGVRLSNGEVVDAETYYRYISASADYNAAAQEYIFDATNIRLREVAIGYTLPQFASWVRNVNVSLVARNLFFLYKEAPFDPEMALGTNNNQQGFESFQVPSARSLGLSVRIGL